MNKNWFGWQGRAKRLFDLCFAAIGLLLMIWLLVIAYVIASIDTHQNGVFVQTRVGKDQRPFRIYKLRTMRKVAGISSTSTTKNDPRVSAVGSFLRKTKIDELFQLINVFNGTMSFVGPRPTVFSDAERMNDRQRERFFVSPGITGLAQIQGNTSLPWPKRIEHDLHYIAHFDLLLDMKIFFKTVAMVLTMKAETHPLNDDEWADPKT